MSGEVPEHVSKRRSVCWINPLKNRVCRCLARCRNGFAHPTSGRGNLRNTYSAVTLRETANDQTIAFKPVQNEHHCALVDGELCGDLQLRSFTAIPREAENEPVAKVCQPVLNSQAVER